MCAYTLHGSVNVGSRIYTGKSLTRQRAWVFPDAGEVFQGLSRRDRPISRASDNVTTSKGPHLPGPACPPAAVRAGTVGEESIANAFLFFSWLLVGMSKSVHPHSSCISSRRMVGTVTTGNVPCFKKKRIRLRPVANEKSNEQAGVVKR